MSIELINPVYLDKAMAALQYQQKVGILCASSDNAHQIMREVMRRIDLLGLEPSRSTRTDVTVGEGFIKAGTIFRSWTLNRVFLDNEMVKAHDALLCATCCMTAGTSLNE